MNLWGYFILGAALVGMIILAVPVSLGYDSSQKWFKVNWLGLTITKRLGKEKSKKPRKITEKEKKIHGLDLAERLWQRRELAAELIRKVGRFGVGVLRTLRFLDSEVGFSLPDPMWNGMLYGILTNVQLQNVSLSVNFEQRNYAKLWVTAYPYRVAWKLAALLIRLPYLNLLRFAWDLKNK